MEKRFPARGAPSGRGAPTDAPRVPPAGERARSPLLRPCLTLVLFASRCSGRVGGWCCASPPRWQVRAGRRRGAPGCRCPPSLFRPTTGWGTRCGVCGAPLEPCRLRETSAALRLPSGASVSPRVLRARSPPSGVAVPPSEPAAPSGTVPAPCV
ncbi:hypothetical protein LUU34_00142900 [Aix galericulata]|nr:hypothetical protein LUU34_00142900 [Aix galericulata]